LFSQVLIEILMHFVQNCLSAKEVSWGRRTVAGRLTWLKRGGIWERCSAIFLKKQDKGLLEEITAAWISCTSDLISWTCTCISKIAVWISATLKSMSTMDVNYIWSLLINSGFEEFIPLPWEFHIWLECSSDIQWFYLWYSGPWRIPSPGCGALGIPVILWSQLSPLANHWPNKINKKTTMLMNTQELPLELLTHILESHSSSILARCQLLAKVDRNSRRIFT
jgi:hypothetical protein